MNEEKRLLARQRAYIGATVEFTSRLSSISCMVRNLSPRGAMITSPNLALLPDEVLLNIPVRGALLPARVVWRNLDKAGLAFADASA